tara:strand:+ start:18733 stop:21189 length:2457 start_codon:yes stop_codon:yes gene_type:complete
MALVSKSIPNFINGISQQPPSLRLASQGEAQENGYSDIVEGLKKRPPTKFKRKLNTGSPASSTYLTATELSTAHIHTYKRSATEQFTVILVPATPKLYVYDIEGRLRYESGVASWSATGSQIATNSDAATLSAYFGTSLNNQQVTATSVADYTFYVNKEKVVTRDETSPDNVRPHEGMFYMKQMNYGKTYRSKILNMSDTIIVNGYLATKNGVSGDTGEHVEGLKTGAYFTYLLETGGTPPSSGSTEFYNPSHDQWTNSELSNANLIVKRDSTDPFVVIESSTSNHSGFKVTGSDDNGGNDLFAFKDTVASFTTLPKFCVDGFTVQVTGDNQKKEDNFFVKYSGSNTAGFWQECPAPSRPNDNQYHAFTTSTMPHTLIQNANESFSFTTGAWDERKAGDDDTNAFPSFVGGKINDVFFHRNRLGFLSDENVIFSEANGFFNFFRTTVRALLDSAPIDVAVSQNEVSILKAAVPFQEQLLLFSEINQFTLSSDQLLTPAEVSIDTSTNFECDLTAKPVGAGNSIFFSVRNGTFSGMREYYTTGNTEVKDANLITAHVPNYLAGNVKQMIASTNENLLLVRTTTDAKELYVYKWYENERERLQSSWSKWKFDVNIAHVAFNNEEIFIIFEDGRFENMTLTLDAQLLNTYPIHLDHQQKFTSGAASMGYTDSKLVYFNSNGEEVTATTAGTSSVPVYAGIPYTFKYQVSEQVYKTTEGDASDIARFQLRNMSFTYNDTGTFTVTQTNGRRDPVTAVFTGRLLGSLNNQLGQAAVDNLGNFKVSVQSQASEAKIEITNASPLPSVFQKAEYEGFVKLRSTRI